MQPSLDLQVRHAAFDFIKSLQVQYLDNIPRRLLEKGFIFQNQRVPLIGPQGIFKPAILPEVPLSITTAPVVEGRARPYEDSAQYNGYLEYKYRGTNPHHHENVGLRKAMAEKVPLLYFQGIVPGIYMASWPVFIVGDDPKNLTFTVKVDQEEFSFKVAEEKTTTTDEEEARRTYSTYEAQRRLHQQGFRVRVLKAYQNHCAICNLGHPPLLDAAHILPDSHPKGVPTTNNGIALCLIHHGAYDSKIIGIRPDYQIELNEKVLKEKDGPMLKYGLQEFHEKKLMLPKAAADRPNPEYLDERYQQFLAS